MGIRYYFLCSELNIVHQGHAAVFISLTVLSPTAAGPRKRPPELQGNLLYRDYYSSSLDQHLSAKSSAKIIRSHS